MVKWTLGPELRSQLNGLAEPIEVCDDSGKTLGHFVPIDVFHKLIYSWANSQVSDEELRRRDMETGGCTLDQVWAQLGKS